MADASRRARRIAARSEVSPERQRRFNVVMRRLLASPLHRLMSGKILVLAVTGRRSGKTYEIPVGYVQVGEAVLVGAGQRGTWLRNLRDGDVLPVLVRGRWRDYRVEVARDEPRSTDLYRQVLAVTDVNATFNHIEVAPDGGPDPESFRRALANGFAVLRLTPAAGAADAGATGGSR